MHAHDLRKCDLRCHCKAPIGSVRTAAQIDSQESRLRHRLTNNFHFTRYIPHTGTYLTTNFLSV